MTFSGNTWLHSSRVYCIKEFLLWLSGRLSYNQAKARSSKLKIVNAATERARALCIWTFITGDWPREKLNIFKLWSPIASACIVFSMILFSILKGLWLQMSMPFGWPNNRFVIHKDFLQLNHKPNNFHELSFTVLHFS